MSNDIIVFLPSGWWFVQVDDQQGWAPASYLEPFSHDIDPDDLESLNGSKFIRSFIVICVYYFLI